MHLISLRPDEMKTTHTHLREVLTNIAERAAPPKSHRGQPAEKAISAGLARAQNTQGLRRGIQHQYENLSAGNTEKYIPLRAF
jgi:hypothetical protein